MHGRASFQASLSHDQGKTWTAVHFWHGGCPYGENYNFKKLPLDTPDGPAVLALTWFNNIGQSEMYMDWASVRIVKAKTPEKSSVKYTDRPNIFIANVPEGDGCMTEPDHALILPDPDTDVEENFEPQMAKHVTRPTVLHGPKDDTLQFCVSGSKGTGAGPIGVIVQTMASLLMATYGIEVGTTSTTYITSSSTLTATAGTSTLLFVLDSSGAAPPGYANPAPGASALATPPLPSSPPTVSLTSSQAVAQSSGPANPPRSALAAAFSGAYYWAAYV